MVQSGSIIKVQNLVYKDSDNIDYFNKIRPMLVICDDEEYFYLLKLSSSLSNERCSSTKYKLTRLLNNKQNYIDLKSIYKIPLSWREESDRLKEKELLEVLKKFLIVQNYPIQDENYKNIEQIIVNEINDIEKDKKH